VKHLYWLIPNLLAGRPGPTYAEWSLPELHAHGFRAVLNLSEFEPTISDFEAAGIVCEWMPIPNSYPEVDGAEAGCLRMLPAAGAFIAKHVDAKQTVLVHCAWGRDRTGTVLAYYLAAFHGLPVDNAIAEVERVQPKAMSAPGWEEMSRRVISSLLMQDKASSTYE
jgi:protein-tyrosine phosphatase